MTGRRNGDTRDNQLQERAPSRALMLGTATLRSWQDPAEILIRAQSDFGSERRLHGEYLSDND